MSTLLTLLQATPPPAAQPWWQVLLDQALLITIGLIFLVALLGVIFTQRRRDRCLKLLHDYHVTFLSLDREAAWGDLLVYARALELCYDAPFRNRRDILKASELIYEPQLEQCLALCRPVEALTEKEAAKRAKQIHKRFQPNIFRRCLRRVRNMLAILKDAFTAAFEQLLAALAAARPQSKLLQQQRGRVGDIGKTLLTTAGNAYEPILERHIGKPIVLEIDLPDNRDVELPGFLVDYTDKYIAVFTMEDQPLDRMEVSLDSPHKDEHLSVSIENGHLTIINAGPDVLIVRSVKDDAGDHGLDVALLPTMHLSIRQPGANAVLHVARSRHVDVVAPRRIARVTFGSHERGERRYLAGLVPMWRTGKKDERMDRTTGDEVSPSRIASSQRD